MEKWALWQICELLPLVSIKPLLRLWRKTLGL